MSAVAIETRPPDAPLTVPVAAPFTPPEPDHYPRPRRFSRAEYYRFSEIGVFGPTERLELIRGEIFVMSPMGAPHATGIGKTEHALRRAFAAIPCHLRLQTPLRLPDDSEPEPDVAVVSGALDDYAAAHPSGADTLLLVEISNNTLAFDQTVKAELYAQSGVREYWILNLRERTLEVRRNPENGAYPPPTIFSENDVVTPGGLTEPVRVADLLPLRTA